MTPYYVGHPVARELFVATIAVWVVSELRQALHHRAEATKKDRGSRLVLGLCFGAAFILAALARAKVPATALPGDAVTFGVGLLIIWVGIGLRWWSFSALGRYFTVDVMTSASQPVIATGPYRFLRHPSYAALLLIFAGIGVTYANWLGLAAMIALPLIGLMYRIRVEEAALSTALGDNDRSYAASRRRIIPYVW